jgi:hypothetical protein
MTSMATDYETGRLVRLDYDTIEIGTYGSSKLIV